MTVLFTIVYIWIACTAALLVAFGAVEIVYWCHHRLTCAMCRRSRASRRDPRVIDFETRRGL